MPFSTSDSSRRFDDNILSGFAVNYRPSLGEVTGAMVEGVYSHPASLTGVSEAEIIARTEGSKLSPLAPLVLGPRNIINYLTDPETYTTGRSFLDLDESRIYRDLYSPMSREDWERSPYYREGVHYHPNMNVAYARVMADRIDRENRQAYILSRASGGSMAGATVLSIVAGIFEPVNLATGFGVSSAASSMIKAAGATAAATSAARTLAGTPTRRAVSEGIVAGAGLEVLAHDIAGVTGEQYTIADSIVNLATSIGASLAIQGVASAYGRMRSRIAEGNFSNYVQHAVNDAIINGRDPMAAASLVNQAVNADTVPAFSTLTREQFNSPQVRQTKRGYEARYPTEEGVVSGAVGRGATSEQAIANLQAHYQAGHSHTQAQFSKQYIDATRRIDELEAEIATLMDQRSPIFAAEAEQRGIPIDELNRARDARAVARGDVRVAQMKVDEFPENRKFARELTAAERRLENAQNVIDNFQSAYGDAMSQLRGDMRALRSGLESERAELSRLVIGEQQKKLADAVQKHYAPDTERNVFSRPYEQPEGEIGAASRTRAADETKVDQNSLDNIQSRLDELRRNNDLNEDDLLEIAAIERDYNREIATQQARRQAAVCLRG